MTYKNPLISQAEFARRTGMQRAYINSLVGNRKLDSVGTKVDTTCTYAQNMLKSYEEKMRRAAGSAAANEEEADKRAREQFERAERKSKMELYKLQQQGQNLDLKNRQLRGHLRDARMMDAAFAELLQSALDRFRGITSELNDIIAAAISDGTDSRAESEARLLSAMEDIAEDIQRQWANMIKSWDSTAVIMSGQDAISDK